MDRLRSLGFVMSSPPPSAIDRIETWSKTDQDRIKTANSQIIADHCQQRQFYKLSTCKRCKHIIYLLVSLSGHVRSALCEPGSRILQKIIENLQKIGDFDFKFRGPKVGGDQVWAYNAGHPGRDHPGMPPTSNWKAPARNGHGKTVADSR